MNVAALQLQQQLAQSLVEHAALMLLTCLSRSLAVPLSEYSLKRSWMPDERRYVAVTC